MVELARISTEKHDAESEREDQSGEPEDRGNINRDKFKESVHGQKGMSHAQYTAASEGVFQDAGVRGPPSGWLIVQDQ